MINKEVRNLQILQTNSFNEHDETLFSSTISEVQKVKPCVILRMDNQEVKSFEEVKTIIL